MNIYLPSSSCRPATVVTVLAALLSFDAAVAQESLTHTDPVSAALSFPASQTSVAHSRTDTRTATFQLPQFDPSIGTLVSVDVRHTTNAATGVTLSQEIASTLSRTGTASLSVQTSLVVPGSTTLDVSASRSASRSVPGTGSVLLTLPSVPANSGTRRMTGIDMTSYIGTGTVAFTMSQSYLQSVSGQADFHYQFAGSASSAVHVTYRYVPAYGTGTWSEGTMTVASFTFPIESATAVETRTDTRAVTLSLPKFNPSYGELQSIDLYFEGSANATCYYNTTTFLYGTYFAGVSMGYTFTLELPGSTDLTQAGSRSRTVSFANTTAATGLPSWNYTSPIRTVTGARQLRPGVRGRWPVASGCEQPRSTNSPVFFSR
ncbi:MAG: choice-of-anchor E domain-containing protein, partial [Planctomycetes bacterium]|nr:choice-of-anchor E domain-containing protein [Planctomycetota bacterium]